MQQIEDMGLGRRAGAQSQFDGAEHGLLVMMQDQSKDFDHLPIAARPFEEMLLQAFEGLGQIDEGRAIAQGSGLALNDRQMMAPIIDRLAVASVRALNDPAVFAKNLAFRDDDDALGIDAQAHRTIGEGGRDAVTDAIEVG